MTVVPTVDELEFKPMQDFAPAPHLVCCCCGCCVPEHGGYSAEIPVDDDSNWVLLICSLHCLQQFCSRITKSVINDYISDTLRKMRQL
jgi:hypothetical protein